MGGKYLNQEGKSRASGHICYLWESGCTIKEISSATHFDKNVIIEVLTKCNSLLNRKFKK